MNHHAVLQQLRKQTVKALSLPKKGTIPAAPYSFSDSDIFTLPNVLTLLTTGLAFLYLMYLSENIKLAAHFALQVGLTTMGICLSAPFFLRLLLFRIQSSAEWLFYSTVIEKLAFSVSLTYISLWLANYIPPHAINAWHLWQGHLVALQLSRFKIETSLRFYEIWLGEAVMIAAFLSIARLFFDYTDRKHERQLNNNQFRLWLGKSTGWLAQLSHGVGLAPKQHLALSLEDAVQNILILGAIGSGKTTRAIHPLLLQLLDQQCGGLIFNIKGDFHQAVNTFVLASNSQDRLTVLGEEVNGFNLIEGLTPDIAASFLKSSLMLSGSQRIDGFWIDTANHLCRNTLGILSLLPDHYNLTALYDYLFDESKRIHVDQQVEALLSQLTESQTRQLMACKHYRHQVFDKFDEKVRTGVLASVAQILEPFNSPQFTDLFCQHSHVKIEDVLNGRVFLVNLPLSRWGLGGRVAYNFIKLRFFNVMQQRSTRAEWNQEKPVFFLCDEYQDVVSGNKDGLSDLNFWDKSRSSKTVGIISAQSISSFYAAIGDRDSANSLLQNFRQKICFRTEDETTLNYLNRLTGHVEVAKRTISKQSGSSSKGFDGQSNTHRSTSESITWVDKSVLDPQLMRKLLPHQAIAILIFQGHSRDDVIEMMSVYI